MISTPRIAERFLASVIGLFLGMVAAGCGDGSQPPPTLGVLDWRPRGQGGPIEIRPLLPASEVLSDYKAWLASDSEKKGRVYEFSLIASNQLQFSSRFSGGDTPVGYTTETVVYFTYRDPANGEYEIFWERRGRHNVDFMKLQSGSKLIWVRPIGQLNARGNPVLMLVAFEGLRPDWVIGAEEGSKPKPPSR